MEITQADYIYSEVYHALVENHDKNRNFTINCEELTKKTISQLKRLLKEENIKYSIEDGNIICWLSEKSLNIAREVYTQEVKQELIEEKERLDKNFMREFIYAIK